MTLRLNGSSSGFTEVKAPAAAGSNTITLPTSNGSAEQFLKNSGTAGELEYSSMVETSTGVGIGTSSPLTRGHLEGTSGDNSTFFLTASNLAANAGGIVSFGGNYDGTNRTAWAQVKGLKENATSGQYGGYLTLSTRANGASNVERVRIEPDGLFRAFSANSVIHAYTGSGAGTSKNLYWGGHSATNVEGAGSTNTFAVKSNGNVLNTNNSYGSLSDVKLKENIVDAASQWEDIKGIRVRKYNFKEETGHETFTQLGVVAQEVETVSPGLVTDSPDLDEGGNDLGTVTKSVNYSVLYMKAVKALQEAQTRIETLETQNTAQQTQIDDLLARVTALEAA